MGIVYVGGVSMGILYVGVVSTVHGNSLCRGVCLWE